MDSMASISSTSMSSAIAHATTAAGGRATLHRPRAIAPERMTGSMGVLEDVIPPSSMQRGMSQDVSDIDTAHSRTVGLALEEDMSSPYAPTLRALHKQRTVLEVELQKVLTAIESLEALDRTTRRRVAIGSSSLLFQGLELQARTARAAAETVLRRVGTPLAGGELRKLIEQGGRPITYRALYNMLKKRKSIFRQLPDKRWSLIAP